MTSAVKHAKLFEQQSKGMTADSHQHRLARDITFASGVLQVEAGGEAV